MESLVKLGLVKSIGLSNFNSEQIERILSVAEIKPVTNQVECSPELSQKKLIKFCKERDIVVTAYRPLGKANAELKHPPYLFDDRVEAIAGKYKKTAAQIILRYLVSSLEAGVEWYSLVVVLTPAVWCYFQVELGTIPIPKSVTKSRIEANIDIFNFALSADDIAVMESFNSNKRRVEFLDGKTSPYWPFKIDF